MYLIPLLVIAFSSHVPRVDSFRQWNYSHQMDGTYSFWRDTWYIVANLDLHSAPRPRRGHALEVIEDEVGGLYLLIFGGRGNEAPATHIPKTYNVEKVFCAYQLLEVTLI